MPIIEKHPSHADVYVYSMLSTLLELLGPIFLQNFGRTDSNKTELPVLNLKHYNETNSRSCGKMLQQM